MMGEYIRRWAAEGAHAGEIQGPFSLEGITAWECDLSGCAPLEPASVQPAHVEACFAGRDNCGQPFARGKPSAQGRGNCFWSRMRRNSAVSPSKTVAFKGYLP